jgi:hypothetical protein
MKALPPYTNMKIPNIGIIPEFNTIDPIDYTILEKHKVVFSDDKNEDYMTLIDVFVAGMNGKNQSNGFYAANRNTTEENAENDQYIGKKGEFFAAHFINEKYGFPLIPIDLAIRPRGMKGWAHDLPYKSHYDFLPNFHVKTCSKKTLRITKRPESWTFQKTDKSIFHRNALDYEYGVFVHLHDLMAKEATIWVILPIHEIKCLLREPVLEKHKEDKVCLYSEEFGEIVNHPNVMYIE